MILLLKKIQKKINVKQKSFLCEFVWNGDLYETKSILVKLHTNLNTPYN